MKTKKKKKKKKRIYTHIHTPLQSQICGNWRLTDAAPGKRLKDI